MAAKVINKVAQNAGLLLNPLRFTTPVVASKRHGSSWYPDAEYYKKFDSPVLYPANEEMAKWKTLPKNLKTLEVRE